MKRTADPQPAASVRMFHANGSHAEPHPSAFIPPPSVAWEYLTLTGGQQHLMNVHGAQGWEAFGVTQVPGQMTIWMKRRKI